MKLRDNEQEEEEEEEKQARMKESTISQKDVSLTTREAQAQEQGKRNTLDEEEQLYEISRAGIMLKYAIRPIHYKQLDFIHLKSILVYHPYYLIDAKIVRDLLENTLI